MIIADANKAEAAMTRFLAALPVLLAGFGPSAARAGFRSPESLVRNVYAYYGDSRAVTLNFILVNGRDGWVISEIESPHDSLRMFLAQYRN
jgi:hypothetical protein